MDTKQLVKNKILLNKVAEYFAKHPKKESVVVRADFGESKIFWRAVRESFNKFAITEVKTVTDSFIFEIGNAGAQPTTQRVKAKAQAKVAKKAGGEAEQSAVAEKPLMTIKMVTAQ